MISLRAERGSEEGREVTLCKHSLLHPSLCPRRARPLREQETDAPPWDPSSGGTRGHVALWVQPYHGLTLWPWASHLAALQFHFFLCDREEFDRSSATQLRRPDITGSFEPHQQPEGPD